MPKKSPTLYDIKKTTIWFAVASVILFVCLVAMILQDSFRDWKGWQRKFIQLKKEQAQEQLAETQSKINKQQLNELEAKLEAAGADLRAKQDEINAIKEKLNELSVEETKANNHYQTLKQYQDSDRYFYEEHMHKGEKEKAAIYAEKLEKRKKEIHEAMVRLESVQAQQAEQDALLKKATSEITEVEKEISKITDDSDRLEEKVQKLNFGLKEFILNAPMLDFMNPTLRIQQAVVENLYQDFYYTHVQRVDRCTTCHLGIDQKGFEDAPQPFTTHPNLDLFLSAESPHSLEEFGCTTCHGGSGHSVNFTTAAHTPNSEEQAKEWEEKYGWYPLTHWTEKMLPSRYIEASCAKCHTGRVEVPRAEKLNEGRQLATTYGCFNCHKVEGFENRWMVGPSLLHVQSKLEEDWIVKWLHDPKEFRESTKMPQIFHLSNTSDEASAEKDNAAIAGIAAYLMKNSEPIELKKPPVSGNPEEGERLVKEIGCLGCHSVGALKANNHGPELSSLGSKVDADWLFTWLKDPSSYQKHSRMPDLRLSDQEAADITAYLLSQKNEKFESIRLPIIKPDVVNGLAIDFMSANMRYEDAKAAVDKMSSKETLEFVGQKMISRQGCFGCHDIKGFENATPVGAELTTVGSKDIHKFDFGYIHIDHTHYDWFTQKLQHPRSFDKGKEKAYLDKLRMPQFGFTDEQTEALTTFLLSLQKAYIPLEMQDVLSESEQEVETGRLLVDQFNCVGCHSLDGEEGRVRAIMDDEGMAPPVLYGEGKKVKEAWLYHFLDQPMTIRPWLKYRMPTFGLDEKQINAFIKYFNHLSEVEESFTANEVPETTPEMLEAGEQLLRDLQCLKCHRADPPKGLSASFLAPNLVMTRDRLRPDWVVDWIHDPQALQEGTMMPTFFYDGQSPLPDVLGGDADKQIRAMRDYLMIFDEEEAARFLNEGKAPAAETTSSAG